MSGPLSPLFLVSCVHLERNGCSSLAADPTSRSFVRTFSSFLFFLLVLRSDDDPVLPRLSLSRSGLSSPSLASKSKSWVFQFQTFCFLDLAFFKISRRNPHLHLASAEVPGPVLNPQRDPFLPKPHVHFGNHRAKSLQLWL